MTDWERVGKLRGRGATWEEIAKDRRVQFTASPGSPPGRALKALYYRRRSEDEGHHKGKEAEGKTLPASHQTVLVRRVVVIALFVVVILVLSYLLVSPPGNGGRPTGWVGRQAPGFSLPIANGEGTFTLSAERGHTNVLLFFNEGLSCAPCLAQMQQLDTDAGQYQPLNVRIVSITGDSQSDMSSWASNSHVTSTDVLGDPTLGVCNAYDTTGAAVSMMPGTAPGHTFILVNMTGVVVWRADYGPSDMSVPESEILQNVQSALRG